LLEKLDLLTTFHEQVTSFLEQNTWNFDDLPII